ncbi:ribonuclease H-like domain-containing protein [Echria macrotheca]|uniref:RNA exonuclease 4 n=1 Tax=Echria macrotheca TaxID=438768 RepID=A0AAJ0B5B6_9PEZI|nr:ribonuclease H-like domain-containing protein [Echria macrotheca]
MSELSSNWKRLQSKIKAADSTSQKRKQPADADTTNSIKVPPPPPRKRQKKQDQSSTSKPAATQPKKKMGTTTSSQLVPPTPNTVTPPDLFTSPDVPGGGPASVPITSETLSEAYNLGLSPSTFLRPPPSSSSAAPNAGLDSTITPGKYLAIDCEMVGIGPGGHESVLARISLVDFHGRQLYDSFVRPRERVTDWRTSVSGVSARDMGRAREFDEVQGVVAELLRGRILVGHDVKHDLEALQLSHPASMIRDTAKFSGFRRYGHGPKPALRVLARELLGIEIQQGQHSSVEDARVAMLLFRRHKPAFDMEHANRFPDSGGKVKSQQSKKKKRKN